MIYFCAPLEAGSVKMSSTYVSVTELAPFELVALARETAATMARATNGRDTNKIRLFLTLPSLLDASREMTVV